MVRERESGEERGESLEKVVKERVVRREGRGREGREL